MKKNRTILKGPVYLKLRVGIKLMIKPTSTASNLYQRGFATLITTIMILLAITLTTLYTANTIVFEQKVSANFNRAEQSLAASMAGVDAALEYYNSYSLLTNTPSSTAAFTRTLADGSKYDVTFCAVFNEAERTTFFNDPENCIQLGSFDPTANATYDPDPENEPQLAIGIVSVGLGDDDTGRRVVSLFASAAPVLDPGSTPAQPLVAGGTVAISGNITIFNRYANATVWSGGDTGAGSNSVETYLNDGTLVTPAEKDANPALNEATRLELTNTNYPAVLNARLSSKADLGLNSDVLDGDPNLSTLEDFELFEAFFASTMDGIRAQAENADQLFTDINDIAGKIGLMWVEGSASYGPFHEDVGTPHTDKSAIIVVDGDLNINGGTIYGLLFVIGDLSLGGGVVILGAVVATGAVDKSGGGAIVVYDPEALDDPPGGNEKSRGVVQGTWRDWGS